MRSMIHDDPIPPLRFLRRSGDLDPALRCGETVRGPAVSAVVLSGGVRHASVALLGLQVQPFLQ